jgi:hypothetical protein
VLRGLSPVAQREGRRYLEQCIPGDRHAFRVYLEAFAALEQLPRTRETPPEVLGAACDHAARLLEAVRGRWR